MSPRWKRFRSGPDDTLVVSLAPQEIELLEQLPTQLRQVFDAPASDPAAARLFPRAYLDPTEEEAEAEFEALVQPELLRDRLDASGLAYEYLDGRTRNREARVRQFQEGPCPLFLISLKAGGLGLNLTAADYVFLLDPWWNPAVEAQAIDRAHRIGQTRAVFAWRLIARDTVEEKVLALQASKRHLADAVVRADASLLRDLRREDLDLLLS